MKPMRRIFFIIMTLFIAPFVTSAIVGYYFVFHFNTTPVSYKELTVDATRERLQPIINEYNSLQEKVGNDLLFLSKLANMSLFAEGNSSVRGKVIADFEAYLTQYGATYQLQYLDLSGQEQVGLGLYRIASDSVVLGDSDVSGKRDNSVYFNQVSQLNAGEIYFSDIIFDEELSKPVIRYATPVIGSKNQKQGVLVLTVLAEPLLDEIRQNNRESEMVYLINNDGYYLAHPVKSKEFGWMHQNPSNFYQDYPDIKQKLTDHYNQGWVEHNGRSFVFLPIQPTFAQYAIYNGAAKLFGSETNRQASWLLISVTEARDASNKTNQLMDNYPLVFIGLSGGVFSVTGLIVFYLILKISDKQWLAVLIKRKDNR